MTESWFLLMKKSMSPACGSAAFLHLTHVTDGHGESKMASWNCKNKYIYIYILIVCNCWHSVQVNTLCTGRKIENVQPRGTSESCCCGQNCILSFILPLNYYASDFRDEFLTICFSICSYINSVTLVSSGSKYTQGKHRC